MNNRVDALRISQVRRYVYWGLGALCYFCRWLYLLCLESNSFVKVTFTQVIVSGPE